MERQWSLEESTVVDAPPAAVYRLVSELGNMGRWSPECRSVVVLSRSGARTGTRFVGFNRRGPFVWFTVGRVVQARQAREFTFDVGVFGLPIARWGYRFEPEGSGTRLTEFWQDLRSGGRRGRIADLLGTVFAGTNPARRIALNRAGMRATLTAIAATATLGRTGS
ncbi:SRPBCC family protein [Streptomyces sp. NPDC057411]|uniref:SRPBCC family protein n=1 Tax=unclassified Streptomyces TaxID=2593676 RepID=UPI003626F73F